MKFIEQWKVTKFCRRARAITVAAKKQKEEREEIIAAMKDGYELPTNGPWVIELSPNGGKEPVDWEKLYTEMYTTACVKKFGVPAGLKKAAEHIEAIKASAQDKEAVEILGKSYVGGVKLHPEVNPSYRKTRTVAA